MDRWTNKTKSLMCNTAAVGITSQYKNLKRLKTEIEKLSKILSEDSIKTLFLESLYVIQDSEKSVLKQCNGRFSATVDFPKVMESGRIEAEKAISEAGFL